MTRTWTANWLVWAVLSAGFAALTAIFGKIGIQGVNSDFATPDPNGDHPDRPRRYRRRDGRLPAPWDHQP